MPNPTCAVLLTVLLLPLTVLPADSQGVLMFHDKFEAIDTSGDQPVSRSESVSADGKAKPPAGQIREAKPGHKLGVQGKITVADGKKGKAFRFSGLSQITYAPATGLIDLTGGEISFWVALNFDPMESNDKNRSVLRNQMFLTVWDLSHGHSKLGIYNAGRENYSVCVQNAEGNIVFCKNFQQVWKPGEWHHLVLKWGQSMELWCDGEKKAAGVFEGLFGSVPVNLKETRLMIGSHIGWGDVDSEFMLDELTIRGPQAGQISQRPRMALPLLAETPTLDGRLDDPFWTKSARVTGFVGFDRKDLAAVQPILHAAATDQGLYFGLEAVLPPGTTPRAMLSERDSNIFTEDSLEIFLQPPGNESVMYQFIASSAGVRFDCKYTGNQFDIGGYNPEWQVKTSSLPGQWIAEVFIPYVALDGAKHPPAGTVWKANFCLDSSSGFSSAATWAFTAGNFRQTVYFGELLFTGKERTVRQEKFTGFQEGEPMVTFDLVGEFKPIITVTGEVFDASGKSIYKNAMLIRDTKSVQLKPPFLTTGAYTMTLSETDEKGLLLFYQNFGFQPAKAFSLSLENYPHAGHVHLRADVKGMKEPLAKVVCNILGPEKNKVTTQVSAGAAASGDMPLGRPERAERLGTPAPEPLQDKAGSVEITEFKKGVGEGRFPNEKLAPGAYTVEARAVGRNGQTLETARQSFQIFEKPSWWKNNLGVDHSVPPPFQPVRLTRKGLSVWGRDYRLGGFFRKQVFPKQITNQQVELLTRAPVFNLKADGQSLDIATLKARKEAAFPDAATFIAQGRIGQIGVACQTTAEFDGFLRFDVTLVPLQPAKVEEFTLAIPLKRELAQLLLASNGSSSSASLLDKEFSSEFVPSLWVGNDDMGICWFAETDRFWNPRDKKMVQVTVGAQEAVMKLNFITQPCAIQQPITFTFGLMATPVRPIPPNNPYAHPSYSGSGAIAFSEWCSWPLAGRAPGKEGTLEFWAKRSQARVTSNTELFHFLCGKNQLSVYLMTPDQPDTVNLYLGQEILLGGKTALNAEGFSHLALVWDQDSLRLYSNGKRVAQAGDKALARFKEVVTGAGGELRFGCKSDIGGYTGLVVDEVRLSKSARYTGESATGPSQAFQADDATLLLDHLDETFRPDGQDAETGGGGVPTIGCSFAPGKFNQGVKIEVAPPRPAQEILKEVGNRVVSHWAWQEPMRKYYGQPVMFAPTVPGLKEEIAGYHQYGLKIIPYLAYPAIPSDVPDLATGMIGRYADEWRIKPVSTTPWNFGAPEGYYFVNCCLRARSYGDYFAAGTAWAMDTFGFDGFYSDGVAHVYACQNQAHGCGYVDENGNRHSTWAIFGVRETLKRMYRVVKSKKPDGYVVNHASFDLMPPLLSFSDVCYTGEHEDYENLTTARVRFTSKPWGIYVALLGSSEHVYSPLHAMVPLLNGTSVWGSGIVGRNDLGRKDAAMRRAYADFNTVTATWVPYYVGEQGYYRVDDPKVKVSLYYHAGKDILLLAANLNAETRKVALQLDLAKFGLAGRSATASNVLTEEKLDLSANGHLGVTIQPKSFRLIRVNAVTK